MKIRLCRHNSGAEQRLARVQEQYPDCDLKLKACAKQCKTCKRQPFVVVDKILVHAETEALLWQRLQELVRKRPPEY